MDEVAAVDVEVSEAVSRQIYFPLKKNKFSSAVRSVVLSTILFKFVH